MRPREIPISDPPNKLWEKEGPSGVEPKRKARREWMISLNTDKSIKGCQFLTITTAPEHKSSLRRFLKLKPALKPAVAIPLFVDRRQHPFQKKKKKRLTGTLTT